ncbi:hypothetical protein [Aurantibacillus circumpalustris]|uniref:hypothetical protein n=1 Tax=Aurantibacillus circumpalustris TaxID=3036359 RepID=UPI00295B2FE0|nr:hypothetical protein [Aurantibacillus circumpalustris]
MTTITPISQLRQEILSLEIKQAREKALLKEQLLISYNSIQPVNLIKNAFSQLTETPDLKNELINTTMGAASGFLVNKLIVRGSHNPLKQILGTLLQIGVSSLVSNKTKILTSVGKYLLNPSRNKRDSD